MVKGLEFEDGNDNDDRSCKDDGGTNRHKWIRTLLREPIPFSGILSLILVVSLLIFTTALTVRYFNHSNERQNIVILVGANEISPTLPNDTLPNVTQPNEMTFISRAEWLAQPPLEEPNPLQTPVPYVIISHTATENCSDQSSCTFHVRYIQSFHIEGKHWWDIGYNFLVGGDGNVYEGRGWTKEGAHAYSYNARSIGIAFIGTFSWQKPPSWQMDACKVLIATGVKEGYIDKNYKLLAARQVTETQAPGQALYEELQTWPHWSATP